MEMSKIEDPSKDMKSTNKAAAHGHSKSNEGHASHNNPNDMSVAMHSTSESSCSLPVPDTLDILSTSIGGTNCPEGHGHLCSSVKKSKTYDCGKRTGLQAESPGNKDGTYWRHRIVTSVSFSGFEAPLQLLCENPDISGSSHEIIDYRNLTPQVPFVPCIAKSIPKKRISLRKPRKAIKDMFRHKHEKALSPGENISTLKRTKKSLRHKERAATRSRYNEHSETLSDSSSECCANVCEDAASLKSFGSQAGCGEIFADEECIVSPDRVLNPVPNKEICESQRKSPTVAGFQGGKECLASPSQTEVLDMFGMWESLSRTFGPSSRTSGNTTPKSPKSENVTANTPTPMESLIGEPNTDVISPKSDNQENTSDEGYCDYVSPGFEDHSKNSFTPVHSNKFPRDTYSGDALYELFCDPGKTEMTPIFDNELDLTDTVIGQCSDLPLSMYSFHVGAEENLAPPLATDFIGQELLQSKWMGKDCLLKLCDTEISLAMGIVNWLKQKTDKSSSPTELRYSHTSGEDTDLCIKYKAQSAGVKKPPREAPLRIVNGRGDKLNFNERDSSQQSVGVPVVDLPFQHNVNTEISTLASPESLPKTPTSGVCFRIFNIDSPLSPSGNLQSPVVSTPGSGTRSMFVLAINKESLCESCKRSLKTGAKNLFLCRSCMSVIEHIKTSDVLANARLSQYKIQSPQPMTRDLLSPASTCGIASDISIASIVERCASQLTSMKISVAQKHLNCDKPEQGVKRKSKHKKRSVATTGRVLHARDCLGQSSFSEDVHKPSVLETERPGFVTNNGPNNLVLKTYKNPSQTTRPTSLPLMASTSSEFSSGEDHHLKRKEHANFVKKKHRLPHHKKSAANSEKSGGFVIPQERKVERRSRMKK